MIYKIIYFSLIYQCLNSLSYSYIAGVRSGKFSSCKVVPPLSLEIHLLCIIALLKFRFNNERSVCE